MTHLRAFVNSIVRWSLFRRTLLWCGCTTLVLEFDPLLGWRWHRSTGIGFVGHRSNLGVISSAHFFILWQLPHTLMIRFVAHLLFHSILMATGMELQNVMIYLLLCYSSQRPQHNKWISLMWFSWSHTTDFNSDVVVVVLFLYEFYLQLLCEVEQMHCRRESSNGSLVLLLAYEVMCAFLGLCRGHLYSHEEFIHIYIIIQLETCLSSFVIDITKRR